MIFWNVLRRVYKLLATKEVQSILSTLIKEGSMRSTALLKKIDVTESQFHPAIKDLVKCGVVEKTVGNDRGVTYSISPFGKHVLKISEPLLDKVKREVGPLLNTS